jgi:O-antigen ligase
LIGSKLFATADGVVTPSGSTGRRRLGTEFLVGLLLGGLFGMAALRLADLELRWIVFACFGSILAVGAVWAGLRQALLAYTLVGLSVDAHYYITQPMQQLYTGSTTPGFISVPLALVPGLALLAVEALSARSAGSTLAYGREVSKPLMLVVITTTIGASLGDMRFIGLCVVWQYLCLLALFLAVLNGIRGEDDVSRATKVLLLVLVSQCAVFFLQLTTGVRFNAVGRIEEAASESGVWHSATGTAAISTAGFATFLDPLVMLAFAMYRTAQNRRARVVYGSVFALGATTIVLTLNRSSWIALPLGIGVTEMLLRKRGLVQRSGKEGRRFRTIVAALVLMFAITAPLFQSKRQAKHMDDFWQRVDLMKPAVNMITSHPILGIGPGLYGYRLRQYAVGYEGWLYIVHNEYLLILAERGLVGFAAYVLLLRAMGRQLGGSTNVESTSHGAFASGAMGGLVAHLWELFWTSGMSFPAYGVIYAMLGISMGAARLRQRIGEDSGKGEEFGRQGGVAVG